jgi:hypothetical protein
MSVGCRDGVLQADVTAVFVPDQSWVADRILTSGLASRVGLRHEQLHFDLKEVYARRIRKMYADLFRPCPRSDDDLHALAGPLRREELMLQERIERDTRGGELEARQNDWESRVAADLAKLEAFAVARRPGAVASSARSVMPREPPEPSNGSSPVRTFVQRRPAS